MAQPRRRRQRFPSRQYDLQLAQGVAPQTDIKPGRVYQLILGRDPQAQVIEPADGRTKLRYARFWLRSIS